MPDREPAAEAGRGSAPLRAFGALVSGMNAAGTCWIVVLMVLINAEAIGRSAFNSPIIGVIEMIEISIIGIVFLQLADSLRRGVMTRSDGLHNQIMARHPALGRTMGAVISILGAAFMALVLAGSIPYFLQSWREDFYIGVEGMFTAPVWPVALIIVFGVTVTMLQFLVDWAGYLRSRDR